MIYRQEYPRPEFERSSWLNLNGDWEFEFDFGCTGKESGMINKEKFSHVINVPFCPESELSGIGYKDFINGCWYRKKVDIKKGDNAVILNFEACYYRTEVFVNKTSVGVHFGGYTNFSFDITKYVNDGENEIVVYVEADSRSDKQPSGKQSFRFASAGCHYTRSTGIWQTVWLEFVPKTYLKSAKYDSDTDNKMLTVQFFFNKRGAKTVTLEAKYDGKVVGNKTIKFTTEIATTQLKLSTLKLWSIENPNLYDLDITVESEDGVDKISSYFGLRKIEMDTYGMRINGKYVYQRLVLDQGYYPDGIYTASTCEALKKDIEISQAVGFNGARLHEKVFERRFLYYADRMGYICWGEYPNWGYNHTAPWATDIYLREWMESVERDYNHPCIVGWCPTNETWESQFRAQQNTAFLESLYNETKRYDPYRPIIDTSGTDHVKTDIFDHHDYDQNVESFAGKYLNFSDELPWGKGYRNQKNTECLPYFMSEYGGIGWAMDGSGWGYGKGPKTIEELCERYCGLTTVLLKNPKICALCYTQLYDVEQEQNGLYTYSREPKFSEEIMAKMKKAMIAKAEMEKIK